MFYTEKLRNVLFLLFDITIWMQLKTLLVEVTVAVTVVVVVEV